MDSTTFKQLVQNTPISDFLTYYYAFIWAPSFKLPIMVTSAGEGEASFVNIPDWFFNKTNYKVPVIAVDSFAFAGREDLNTVVLPSHIRTIREGTFSAASICKGYIFHGASGISRRAPFRVDRISRTSSTGAAPGTGTTLTSSAPAGKSTGAT